MAAGDLTTLANVKAWLSITTVTDDSILSRLITAISGDTIAWLNRPILSASYTESRTGTGSNMIALANYPCTSFESLVIAGQPIVQSPDGIQAGYVFDDRFLYLVGNAFASSTFPSAAPGQFPKWPPLGIKMAYTAGFATTPFEIEQAVIEWISLRYTERNRIGQQSKSMQGEVVSFFIGDMPASVKTILNNYRKVIPV
jgi:hypothetical protein